MSGARLAWWATMFQATLAIAIGVIASGVGHGLGPPEPVPRGLAVGVLYLVPAAVGGIGAWGRRASLLAAAALLCLIGSWLSFVTLVFIVPGFLFAAAAAATSRSHRPRSVRSLLGGALIAALIIGLGLGAGITLLATTEGRCWTAYSTATGTTYTYQPYVPNGETTLAGDAVAGGCDSGVLTLRGAALAAALGIGGVALAGGVVEMDRRRHRETDVAGPLVEA